MILSYLIEGLKKYKKKNSEIDNYIYPWGTCPNWNLQKYLPKQGYHGTHCEATCPEVNFRVMAWMIYLNTVKDKGGTHFPLQRKTTSAEEGKLVVFPGFMQHHVPNNKCKERITIAGNIMPKEFDKTYSKYLLGKIS